MWAKNGCKVGHSLIPNVCVWLTILLCISTCRDHIPGFYIIKDKRMKENYVIEHCEDGASIVMQPEGWMNAFLFSQWV